MSVLENKENKKSASYENLDMDNISGLLAEGYEREAVLRALGIAKNDLPMAKEILKEFATRKS